MGMIDHPRLDALTLVNHIIIRRHYYHRRTIAVGISKAIQGSLYHLDARPRSQRPERQLHGKLEREASYSTTAILFPWSGVPYCKHYAAYHPSHAQHRAKLRVV